MKANKLTILVLIFSLLILTGAGFAQSMTLTLTVVPFQTIGNFENADIFAFGLPEAITNDLSKIPGITVVERLQLSAVIREHKLAQAGFIDEAKAPEIGKMLGADVIVTGTVQKIGVLVRVQTRAIKVYSGAVSYTHLTLPTILRV